MPDDIESAFWESAKCRESIGEAYENLYYTPVFSLISFKTSGVVVSQPAFLSPFSAVANLELNFSVSIRDHLTVTS